MHPKSILTKVFPDCGFSTYNLCQLNGLKNNANGKYEKSKIYDNEAVFEEWLPYLPIGGNGYYFNLSYREVSSDMLQAIKSEKQTDGESSGLNRADFITNVKRFDETNKYVQVSSEGGMRKCLDSIFKQKGIYIFETVIYIDENVANSDDVRDLCKRKELVALELTSAYRQLIQKVLYLYYLAMNNRKGYFNNACLANTEVVDQVHGGSLSSNKLHSSIESSHRLIASFQEVDQRLTKYNNSESLPSISGYADLAEVLLDPNRVVCFEKNYLDLWESECYVAKEIALKKTFEYFIYKGVFWSNC